MDIVIKNALVLTQNQKREVVRTDVGIEGNMIAQVGPNLPKSGYVIDGSGCALMPGLVNAHTHLSMTLLRGFADDMELESWWRTKIWPTEAKIKEEDCYYGALLGCLEMIRSGTTAFFDMYFHMEYVAQAIAHSGLRANLGYGMVDMWNAHKRVRELRATGEFLDYVRHLKNSMIECSIAPHAPNTCSEELLLASKQLAEKNGCRIQIHASETRKEVYEVQKRTGKRPVEYLDSIGFLGEECVLAHGVWLTKHEVSLLAKNGCTLVHNPVSNQKLASGGIAPLPEMLQSGVNVTLGTDGCASNNNLDLFEEIKFCAISQKNARWDPTVIPAGQALDFATVNGGKLFGGRTGSIEEGKLADMILVDLKKPHLAPVHNLKSLLAYSARGGDVKTMICGGKILMEDYAIKVLDEQAIILKAQECAERIVRK